MIEGYEKPILLEDLGMRFPNENSKRKRRYGIFKCFCGNEFEAQISSVKRGHSKSCGCIKGKHSLIHKSSNTKLYKVYYAIKHRCYSINNKRYCDYGGRGIGMCAEWEHNFLSFKSWALENGYVEGVGLSIDRIDVDGDYEPNNCRWVTQSIQTQNTQLISKNNSSGFRGVSWSKRNKKWYSSICLNYKVISLGHYVDINEAVSAYDLFVLQNNLPRPINRDLNYYEAR